MTARTMLSAAVVLTLLGRTAMAADGGRLNVRDYGAVPDGTTDSTSAIQAAIDAALADTSRPPIYLPGGGTGCYRTTRPLLVHAETLVRLLGETGGMNGGTCINASGFIGPTVHMRGAIAPSDLDFTASLAAGRGRALLTNPSTWSRRTWLDLVDAGTDAYLDRRPRLTVRLFMKAARYTTGFRSHVLESSGSLMDSGSTQAFRIGLDASGHLSACINVAGTCTEIQGSGVLALDTVHYIELSYDGSAVRLFYGKPGATTTQAGRTVVASGPVTMGAFETLSLGGARQHWPHGDALSEPLDGAVDSIELSAAAGHTAPFAAPTAKHVANSDTLLLENFDEETSDFSIIATAHGRAYLPKRGEDGTQGRSAEMSHIRFLAAKDGGSTLFLNGVIQSSFHDLSITGGMYGIDAAHDVFLCQFERLVFRATDVFAKVGLAATAQAGINRYGDLDFTAWPVAFLSRAGSGELSNFYTHGGEQVVPVVLREGSWVLSSLRFSNEDARPQYRANLYAAGNSNLEIIGGEFERYINAGPAIIVHGGGSVTIVGGHFMMHPEAAAVIEVTKAPADGVSVVGARKSQERVPWSTSASVTLWPSSLAGAPAVAGGFGTTASIAPGATTRSFRINVGGGESAASGVVTMPLPPATTGWNCHVNNLTAAAAHRSDNTRQTSSTTTTITIENQTTSSGASVAWTANDIVAVSGCEPY